MRRSWRALPIAIALGGVLAAPAGAATVLGSNLADAGEPAAVTGSEEPVAGTVLNTAASAGVVTAPTNGVITRFRVRNGVGSLRLVVIQGPAGARSLVTNSEFVPVSGPAVQEFFVTLPIAAGQTVGIELARGSKLGLKYVPGSRMERYDPPLEGTPRAADYADPNDYDWLYNAVFEGDADNDGLGDETQDPDHGGADVNKVGVASGRAKLGTSVKRQVACPVDFPIQCAGTVTLRWKGKSIGRKAFSLAPGASAIVSIAVKASVRRQLRRKRTQRLVARLTVDGLTAVKNVTFTLRT